MGVLVLPRTDAHHWGRLHSLWPRRRTQIRWIVGTILVARIRGILSGAGESSSALAGAGGDRREGASSQAFAVRRPVIGCGNTSAGKIAPFRLGRRLS